MDPSRGLGFAHPRVLCLRPVQDRRLGLREPGSPVRSAVRKSISPGPPEAWSGSGAVPPILPDSVAANWRSPVAISRSLDLPAFGWQRRGNSPLRESRADSKCPSGPAGKSWYALTPLGKARCAEPRTHWVAHCLATDGTDFTDGNTVFFVPLYRCDQCHQWREAPCCGLDCRLRADSGSPPSNFPAPASLRSCLTGGVRKPQMHRLITGRRSGELAFAGDLFPFPGFARVRMAAANANSPLRGTRVDQTNLPGLRMPCGSRAALIRR